MKKQLHFLIALGIAFFFLTTISYAQVGNKSQLSIKEIMQGDDFVGHLPSRLQWSDNSKILYFNWNTENAISDSLYTYKLSSEEISKVNFETQWEMPSNRAIFNKDKSKKLYAKNGDLFLLDLSNYVKTQITNTLARESNPHFTTNESKVAYRNGNNLFTWEISTGKTVQVTDFKKDAPQDKPVDDKDQWLKDDQIEMFNILQENKERKEEEKKYADQSKLKRPLPIPLKGMVVMSVQLSPDGNYVTYIMTKQSPSKRTIVPQWVSESGYTGDQNTRSKVGDKPATYKMFIYDINNRKTYAVESDSLEGIDYVPEYTLDYPDKKYENKDRVGSISAPVWSEDGQRAFIEINSNDYKDRWLALLNMADGTIETIEHQHDEAWIAGPGIGWFSEKALGWMPDDRSIWFVSEVSGYAHLYSKDVVSKKVKALTKGKFEVFTPQISNDKKYWYFTSSKGHPGERHFYSMPINGGKAQRITTMTGNNEVELSPDEKYLAIRYSYSNKPWEIFLMKNPLISGQDENLMQITKSTTANFKDYEWRVPENITFKAEDGVKVHARLYQPRADVKNKAAVIFVHGAGYLQNAHKWWSSYGREYMFHNILADNGYTVLDIDYRASSGYGRDWRTGIYRHMGGKDLSDQVDGVKHLVDKYDIDPEKVGIYGGSYGGFITLMAMFNEPKTFKAGAALRSVTDWAHYNHGYTARILNTPATDSLAYRRSSPIYFAEGLQGKLLMLHGMIDDNVHFQDVVRLSQRFIELGKEDWEMAIFPVERHGFTKASSWTDEYTRIFKLFQETLLNK
ncbi:MAG: S9 family peptidase [Bacteroidetes bacterium]|nr:S9 family peptidase [Bacteroidota bacterium]